MFFITSFGIPTTGVGVVVVAAILGGGGGIIGGCSN